MGFLGWLERLQEVYPRGVKVYSYATCIICLLASGMLGTFGLYSKALQHRLHYTDTNITVMQMCGYLGVSLGGLIAACICSRYGSHWTLFTGCGASFISNMILSRATDSIYVYNDEPRSASLVALVICHAMSMLGVVCTVVAATSSLRDAHQFASSLVTGVLFFAFGASSAAFQWLYSVRFDEGGDVKSHHNADLKNWYLLFATSVLFVNVLAMIGTKFERPREENVFPAYAQLNNCTTLSSPEDDMVEKIVDYSDCVPEREAIF